MWVLSPNFLYQFVCSILYSTNEELSCVHLLNSNLILAFSYFSFLKTTPPATIGPPPPPAFTNVINDQPSPLATNLHHHRPPKLKPKPSHKPPPPQPILHHLQPQPTSLMSNHHLWPPATITAPLNPTNHHYSTIQKT